MILLWEFPSADQNHLWGYLYVVYEHILVPPVFSNPSSDKGTDDDVQPMLKEDIIRTSKYPWKAKMLVTWGKSHEQRMVTDYPPTKDQYKNIYRLLRTDNMVGNVANFKI